MAVVVGAGGLVVSERALAAAVPGEVRYTIAEASGSYAIGFCRAPANPVAFSYACTDGSSATVKFHEAGTTAVVDLDPVTWNAAMIRVDEPSPLSPVVPVAVLSAKSIVCSFTIAGGPSCGAPSATLVVPAEVEYTVAEDSGSYAVGFCRAPADPVALSYNCSDGSPAVIEFTNPAGATKTKRLTAGLWNAAMLRTSPTFSGLSPIGPIALVTGSTVACSLTMAAAPSCAAAVPMTLAVVRIADSDPGTYVPTLCPAGELPTTAALTCLDGSPLLGFSGGPGAQAVLAVTAGTAYDAAQVSTSGGVTIGTAGPVGPFAAGTTANCTFLMTAAPSCTAAPDTDDDGVADRHQNASVETTPGSGTTLDVQTGNGAYLDEVTVAEITDAPPASVQAQTGLIGFQVSGVAPGATVQVALQLPPGVVADRYYKQRSGAWVDATSIATFGPDGTVTLSIVDGGEFDDDGLADGVVVDPGFFGKAEGGVPARPTGVVARTTSTTGSTGSLVVSFVAGPTGGSPIIRFRASCSSSDGGVTQAATGTASPLTVAGVDTGKTYRCSVRARNSSGAGPQSGPSQPVIVGSPQAPTLLGVSRPVAGTLRVVFAPNSAHGSPITGFIATCTSRNGGAAGSRRVSDPAQRAISVAGLSAGSTYRCRVRAVNSRGPGALSAPSAPTIG